MLTAHCNCIYIYTNILHIYIYTNISRIVTYIQYIYTNISRIVTYIQYIYTIVSRIVTYIQYIYTNISRIYMYIRDSLWVNSSALSFLWAACIRVTRLSHCEWLIHVYESCYTSRTHTHERQSHVTRHRPIHTLTVWLSVWVYTWLTRDSLHVTHSCALVCAIHINDWVMSHVTDSYTWTTESCHTSQTHTHSDCLTECVSLHVTHTWLITRDSFMCISLCHTH